LQFQDKILNIFKLLFRPALVGHFSITYNMIKAKSVFNKIGFNKTFKMAAYKATEEPATKYKQLDTTILLSMPKS